MPDSVLRRDLNQRPDEPTIASLRNRAAEEDTSIEAYFPAGSNEQKRLVVSPRGTVVLLNDVSEATFNRSQSADEIAEAIRDS